MRTIYEHELKNTIKTLFIWFICAGGMGFACILLFASMKDSMENMAESFASMGAFSDAFGMSQLSMATLPGFYATEVGTIHGLGSAMFAAIISTSMLSKEEDGHTSEFLFSLPISRSKVVVAKWCATATLIFLFHILCIALYLLGIVILGEKMPMDRFFQFHALQFLMSLELSAICYGLSACMKKNKIGLGLGIVLLFYAYDLIARVVPDLSDSKFLSPFSYANPSEIFSTGNIDETALLLGIAILILGMSTAHAIYTRRDLAA